MTSPKREERLLQYDDVYPSRLFPAPSVQQRLDPVVYGRGEPPIDPQRLADYAYNGFAVLDSPFSDGEIRSFIDELARIRRDKRIVERREAVTGRHSRSLCSLYGIHRINALFSKLAADERIVRIAQYILGSDVYVYQSRLNLEPGLRGESDYWHSDFETWHTEDGMPRMRALSVAILLREPDASNGPLMFIPGSHHSFVACTNGKSGRQHNPAAPGPEMGTPDDTSIRDLVNHGGIEMPKGPPGTVIVFDCNTMYGANSNITPYPRETLYLVYNSVDNQVSEPYCGDARRPEFRAARHEVAPVKPTPLTLVK
jgi:ectoine hydroxylase